MTGLFVSACKTTPATRNKGSKKQRINFFLITFNGLYAFMSSSSINKTGAKVRKKESFAMLPSTFLFCFVFSLN
jgi:hypothetical protein